jgi:hypothetical protein
MSQENVEIVRRGWEARMRGDVDAVFAVFDPAVEWDTTKYEGWPEDSVYRGHDGVRKFLEDWTQVCRVKDGMLRRSEAWSDRRKAFESVGPVE